MARKRRGNGEGSIFQRADGKWCGSISIGYNANGKRRRRTVYGGTKREVQEKIAKLQHQKSTGTLKDTSKLTVAQYLDRWLQDSARTEVRPSTFESYASMVRLHINPAIGGVSLSKLEAMHVRLVLSSMEENDESARMRQYARTILRLAIDQAVADRMLPYNVCDAVKSPKVTKYEIQPLSSDGASAFLKEAAGDRLSALYVLAVTTGMRQGELFGLEWDDIDLQAGTLSVRRTLVELKGKFHFGEPKSSKGKRLIELPTMAVDALWEHKQRMLAEGHAGCKLVFCDNNGGPLRRQNVLRRSFRPILKRAELPTIRFHDLRHTAATLLLLANVNPKIVSELLGHAKVSFTLDVYSHVLPTMQKAAADQMDRMLKTGTA